MKSFLAAVFFSVLPVSCLASDLDSADIENYTIPRGKVHYSEIKIKDVHHYECGSGPGGGASKNCLVTFDNDRISVNGSPGITPEQVKTYSWEFAPGRQSRMHVVYENSSGKVSIATFAAPSGFAAQEFLKRFMIWINNSSEQMP